MVIVGELGVQFPKKWQIFKHVKESQYKSLQSETSTNENVCLHCFANVSFFFFSLSFLLFFFFAIYRSRLPNVTLYMHANPTQPCCILLFSETATKMAHRMSFWKELSSLAEICIYSIPSLYIDL